MSRLRYNWTSARAHLESSCPRLCSFIRAFGSERLHLAHEPDLFVALSRSIAYQQLSGKAAATIYGRFCALCPDEIPRPEPVLKMNMKALRAVGLSEAKARSIQDLATKCMDGTVPSRARLGRLDDEQVIERLIAVRGIGPWTAQMVLIFNLGRPDVMPASDLGVQKGVARVYGLAGVPSPRDVITTTAHLSPFRSAASWYFWRAADTTC